MRARGALHRFRIRAGAHTVALGSTIASSMVDLGLTIAPEISLVSTPSRRWAGLGITIIVLLIAGLLFTGQTVRWAIHEALPRREIHQ